uniref:Putative ovule protein n=1 Tax=Solanum chacoense TaxID=4108 RepID=A0A0V0IMX7_SOLCH
MASLLSIHHIPFQRFILIGFSSHRACLVRVTSPMWFASYCIGAGVLPCVHPKGSDGGFLSS